MKMPPPKQKHCLKCNRSQVWLSAGKLWAAFAVRLLETWCGDLIITHVHLWQQVMTIGNQISVNINAGLPGNNLFLWFPPPSEMILMAAFINKAQREIHGSVYTRVSHRYWRTEKQLRVLAAAAREPGGLQGHSLHSQSRCPLLQMNMFTCRILDCASFELHLGEKALKWRKWSRFNMICQCFSSCVCLDSLNVETKKKKENT